MMMEPKSRSYDKKNLKNRRKNIMRVLIQLFELDYDSIFLFIGEKSYKELRHEGRIEGKIAERSKMFINAYTDSIIRDEDGDNQFDYKD